MTTDNQIIELTITIDAYSLAVKASQLLAQRANLSQATIKDAMHKGAVWLISGKQKRRLRRASKPLQLGDVLELNYNAQLLAQTVPEPQLLHDAGQYSVWFKPYGLHCQASRWGDFASIDRWVELNLPNLGSDPDNQTVRPVFLVHRLDRATTGAIVLCHSKNAARLFSAMFRDGQVDKRYQAIVQGDFSVLPADHEVNIELEGKACTSLFSYVAQQAGMSLVDVKLLTGRKHQIRQHLSALNFPIIGDRLYGDNTTRDLQLQSVSLQFVCPFSQQPQQFVVPDKWRLSL